MSKVQHDLAIKLLGMIAKAPPPREPTTYKQAAIALGRDGKSNARMIAQVCDLLDAAAAHAKIPLLALVAVQESSMRYNHKAFADAGTPSWLREAIIEYSLQHRFSQQDFAAIAVSLQTLTGLGNRAAWKKFSNSISKEKRYSQLTGIEETKISEMLRDGEASQTRDTTSPQYWAFVADPGRYKILEAVASLRTDTWTSKGKPINVGDFAAIWQSRNNLGSRGIVALAQIVEPPRLRSDKRNPYWVNQNEGNVTTERVGLRYVRIHQPLWTNGQHRKFLESLSVARARGGTVFRITEEQWSKLRLFADDVDFDIEEVKIRPDIKQTQREALIQARLGQGRFRLDLFKRWGGCAVVGSTLESVLRASHIKPWRKSSDRERLDPANGILLVANLDALFNDGLITFADNGEMIISDRLSEVDRTLLRVRGRLIKSPSTKQQSYLKYHRENEFIGKT